MIPGAEDGLERILNSPESMAKIAEIARSLREGSTVEAAEATSSAEPANEIGGIAQALAGLNPDPILLRTISTAMRGYTASDRRTRLLEAVRPFASGENARLVDRALQAVRLARTVGTVLRERGGGDHLV